MRAFGPSTHCHGSPTHKRGIAQGKVAYSSNTAVRRNQWSLHSVQYKVASSSFASTGSPSLPLRSHHEWLPCYNQLRNYRRSNIPEKIFIPGTTPPPSALLALGCARQLRNMQHSLLAGSLHHAAIHFTTHRQLRFQQLRFPTISTASTRSRKATLQHAAFASSKVRAMSSAAIHSTTTHSLVRTRPMAASLLATSLHLLLALGCTRQLRSKQQVRYQQLRSHHYKLHKANSIYAVVATSFALSLPQLQVTWCNFVCSSGCY